eukprot:356239-Chlamydomonas_euryale.AAC.3
MTPVAFAAKLVGPWPPQEGAMLRPTAYGSPCHGSGLLAEIIRDAHTYKGFLSALKQPPEQPCM